MGLTCFKSWKYENATHQDGNRDVPVSPDSYFFMSNSNGQGEEWLKTLNKVVWLPFTGVFGQRLEDTVQYERRYGDRTAPLIVEQCVNFIQSRGLLEVGLFRQPGQATLVKELQDAFDAGEKPSFDSSTDVHTVASLLKLYLRELPEPVVPFSKYDDFLLCAKLLSGDRQQGLVQLKKLLQELPNANFNLLHYICGFLNEVQSYCHINKMSTQNLATVFGPNLLRPKAEDPETIIGGTALVQQLMSVLISDHSKLFLSEAEADGKDCLLEAHCGDCGDCGEKPREVENTGLHSYGLSPASESDNLPGETQLVPRACVRQLSLPLIAARRGLSKNPTQADRSASSQSHIISRRPRCQSEMENQASEESSPGSSSDPLYDNYCSGLACQVSFECHSREEETTNETQATSSPSPCHCTRTTQGGSFSTPVNPHNSWEEDSRKTQSCAGEKHRSSLVEGEQSKTYESMLSVYDNIESGALPPKPQDMTSIDSTSWSSCEVVLVHTPERDRVSYYRTDPEELPASSSFRPSSALSGNPRSNSSSEVFLAPQEACSPSSPTTMHNLLSGLKQQMARQKEEYEAQIRSLEQRNEELEKEVRDLHSNLEQQRRWYSVAEIKMRNAERARADAERRNSMLQREMEVFFDTFGELTKEAKKTERIVQSF